MSLSAVKDHSHYPDTFSKGNRKIITALGRTVSFNPPLIRHVLRIPVIDFLTVYSLQTVGNNHFSPNCVIRLIKPWLLRKNTGILRYGPFKTRILRDISRYKLDKIHIVPLIVARKTTGVGSADRIFDDIGSFSVMTGTAPVLLMEDLFSQDRVRMTGLAITV